MTAALPADEDRDRAAGVVVHLAARALSPEPGYTESMTDIIAAALRAVRSEERAASADLRAVAEAARELNEARKESVRLTETVPVDDIGSPGFIQHTNCLQRILAAFKALDAALSKHAAGAGGGG